MSTERPDMAKGRMVTAASQRERIKHLESVNADLLAALKEYHHANRHHEDDLRRFNQSADAIARAEGRT